ncbi:hypothetical protein [Piscinibacter gummiphilus]|uniref:Uncharacterized protein n=1 Tax=Piscinibacter gummiphilus TaxID=946333 RepID=A0ABZ0CUC3_9BURK|nr:hypothetical protein [Piscinibacter gummiphilus]WOB06493.1 hypothetical protein RXV79_16345 [Piscinibacter gummiphilus]
MKGLGCNYEAPTFGARYPDGTCIDGYMWDLDSCDEPGGPLYGGGDEPCPWCNTLSFIEWRGDTASGNAHQRRVARRAMVAKVRAWAEERSSFPPAPRPAPPAPPTPTPRQVRVRLTDEAEEESLDFYRRYGEGNCSCHLSPPCGSCTHPGNPLNQAEDDSAWVMGNEGEES